MTTPRPRVAVLGAGPIGLEAALAAARRGFPFHVYEAADDVAGYLRSWGHLRLFTPWDLNVSPAARSALAEAGIAAPSGSECPTGAEFVARVLRPLADISCMRPHVERGARVLAVGRHGLLKQQEIASTERGRTPFRILVRDAQGVERVDEADLVLDCTGTYGNPNRMGDGGIPAPGEEALASLITRHLPDFRAEAGGWLNRTILLVGAGHSAQTAAVQLAALAGEREAMATRVVWILGRQGLAWKSPAGDPLTERAALVRDALRLRDGGSPFVETRSGMVVDRLVPAEGRVVVTLRGARSPAQETVVADRILSLTGYVGDHGIYRQLQVHECYATDAPMKLSGALLGSATEDCLDQSAHGVDTLVNPEPGFYILGSKSYGRNATFLMRVGWEQVEELFESLSDRGPKKES